MVWYRTIVKSRSVLYDNQQAASTKSSENLRNAKKFEECIFSDTPT
jgi:hypothetical protein